MLSRHYLPVLVRPQVFGLRNRIRTALHKRTLLARDIVVATFSIAVVFGIYHGTTTVIGRMSSSMAVAYFPPSLPLGLLFMMLMMMLLLSNAVAALGTLFLARDLDLILAAPTSLGRFFAGKLSEVAVSTSWVALIFGVPTIVAFGVSYHASLSFYGLVALTLIPYFIIPSCLALTAVTIFTTIVPAQRTREILFIAVAMLMMSVYFLLRLIGPAGDLVTNFNEMIKMVALLSLPNTVYSPSYWAATVLGEYLVPTGRPLWPYLLMLYGTAFVLLGVAYVTMATCYDYAYSKSKNNLRGVRLRSKASQARLRLMTPGLSSQSRAILGKEFKLFARDMTQALQLILLLGLCMLYLYNFRVLHAVEGLPPQTRGWWEGFLTIANFSMGAFVTTAVCTRFVFPSLSLEGQSFWLLQTAPLTLQTLLRAKFRAWLPPVAAMASVVFAAGSLALSSAPEIILFTIVASWCLCYGLVGLAIGLGATFAHFEWEHSSQLAASFGSLIFMLTSTVLILLSLVPTGTLIALRTLQQFGQSLSDLSWYGAVVSTLALLAYLNFATARWALNLGAESLERRK